MSPQPKADPKKAKATEPVDPYAGLSDENHNEFAQNLIGQANDLQKEKESLLERIDNNRTLLRQVVASGFVSEKQAKFVALTYPPRTKKDSAENGATSTTATSA